MSPAGSPRWLFSPLADGALFSGVALLSGLVALVAPFADTPPLAWLLIVVCLDVAHVWSTLFRVYFDPAELARRPLLAWGAPLAAYALGVCAHEVSPAFFWTTLAYVAVWHFIRQQVGWMTLYGRRARDSERDLRFDRLAMYGATLGPVLWWHANLPRAFWWFREGDFMPGLPSVVGTGALWLDGAVLISWLGWRLSSRARLHWGKVLLLGATHLSWFGGIVLAPTDFVFTVMNVTLHGVPYLFLLFRYARGREAEGGYGALGVVVRAGLPAFMGVLMALAFAEELAWDRLVWHDHPQFFGASTIDLSALAASLLVPLLALPQTTHYLLDGFIWRTSTDPNLAARLGWAPPLTRRSDGEHPHVLGRAP